MRKSIHLLLLLALPWNVPDARAQRILFERDRLPQPVFHAHPGLVELYWTAWEQAWNHVKSLPGTVRERYVDEGKRDDVIWLQDAAFMALFCKYSPYLFPGAETLDRIYYKLLEEEPSPLGIEYIDNPPLLAWVESEYYRFTGNEKRIRMLLHDKKFLQRYFDWFDGITPATRLHFPHQPATLEKREHGYRWSSAASGMDDSPRGRDDQPDLLWVDAIAQQALSALSIARLAGAIANKEVARVFRERYRVLKETVNKFYWDEETGTYHDLHEGDLSRVKTKTPAAYWVMLAEIPTPKQARQMADHVRDTGILGGNVPWSTLSRDDPRFDAEGGDVWMPVAYAGIKALEKYGFLEEADDAAYNLLLHQYATFANFEPHTLWESYNVARAEPSRDHGSIARGWSALCPISLLIENVLGFHHVDASSRVVEWRKYRRGLHGIKNLAFGDITTDIIGDDHTIQVETNEAFTLIVNGKSYRVRKGSNTFR